jgi:hypothetical protein
MPTGPVEQEEEEDLPGSYQRATIRIVTKLSASHYTYRH